MPAQPETFSPEPEEAPVAKTPMQVATNVTPAPLEPAEEPPPAPIVASPTTTPAIVPPKREPAPDSRLPVPTDAEQSAGKKLLAELFKAEYDEAKKPEQKEALAKKLLTKSAEMRADAVGYYLLLKLVADVATSAGDVASVLQATDAIADAYQVDALNEKLAALEALAKLVRSQSQADVYLKTCRTLAAAALEEDDFPHAKQALELAEVVAKRGKLSKELEKLSEQQKIIADRQLAYAHVPAARSALETSASAAHLEIGRYQCFYRRQWEEGLAHLAESSDVKLKVIAQIDLARPSTGPQQADLGDQWYELSRQQTKAWAKRSLELRAAYWYAQAASTLPNGLMKSKVQKRLSELSAAKSDAMFETAPASPATSSNAAPASAPMPPAASEGFNNG
jgi:hypothetical protein